MPFIALIVHPLFVQAAPTWQDRYEADLQKKVATCRLPAQLTLKLVDLILLIENVDRVRTEEQARQALAAVDAIIRLSNFLTHRIPTNEYQDAITNWAEVLEESARSGMQYVPANRPITCSPTWWSSAFLSWYILDKPRLPATAFMLAEHLKKTGCTPNEASTFLVEVGKLEIGKRSLAVAMIIDDGYSSEQIRRARNVLNPVVPSSPRSVVPFPGPTPQVVEPTKEPTRAPATRNAPIVPRRRQRAVSAPTEAPPVTTAPTIVRSIVSRRILDAKTRKLRPTIDGVLKTLKRNGYVGSNRVSFLSLRNLTRKECPSEPSNAEMNNALEYLAQRGIVQYEKNTGISLAASSSHPTGQRILERLSLWLANPT